jgi:hypothetical protein
VGLIVCAIFGLMALHGTEAAQPGALPPAAAPLPDGLLPDLVSRPGSAETLSHIGAVLTFTLGLFWAVSLRHTKFAGLSRGLEVLYVTLALIYSFAISIEEGGAEIPAVLVMAVAGIVTAIHHWQHLGEAATKISEQAQTQRVLEKDLSDAAAKIAAQAELQRTLQKDLGDAAVKISEQTELQRRLVNEISGEDWREKIYSPQRGSYRGARRRIYGVIRFFDIDKEWSEGNLPSEVRAWARLDRYVGSLKRSLWASWRHACENALPRDKPESSPDDPRRDTTLRIKVVAEMPIPENRGPIFSCRDARSFFGMLWWLILMRRLNTEFRHVRPLRPRAVPSDGSVTNWPTETNTLSLVAQMQVGISPVWVNVVDDEVWQVFSDGEVSEDEILKTKIRSITQPYEDSRAVHAPVVRPSQVADSYAAIVEADFARGGRAQYYARAVFRIAFERLQESPWTTNPLLERESLRGLLSVIGITDVVSELDKDGFEDVVLLFLAMLTRTHGFAKEEHLTKAAVQSVLVMSYSELYELLLPLGFAKSA